MAWGVNPTGFFASVFNGTYWSSAASIIPSGSVNNLSPSVSDTGVALVAYQVNGPVNSINVASYDGSIWITQLVFSSTGSLTRPAGGIDRNGNGIVAWSEDISGVDTLESSVRNGLNGSWSPQILIATAPGSLADEPFVVTVAFPDDPVLLWGAVDPISQAFSSINVSIGEGLFIPQPISNLQNTVIKNKFLNETIFANRLTRTAAVESTAVAYLIFRNGTLIGEVPVGVTTFIDQCPGKKHKTITYTVVAVNSSGMQSSPVSITVTVRK